jgi:hypothetical protein
MLAVVVVLLTSQQALQLLVVELVGLVVEELVEFQEQQILVVVAELI